MFTKNTRGESILVKLQAFTKAANRGVLQKKVFLDSILIKLQA